MKKILITGGGGLLGQHFVDKLIDEFNILAIDIAVNPFDPHQNLEYIKKDLTKFDTVKPVIDDFAPELVFNCAGTTDVDACEQNRKQAYTLNVGLVENLLTTKAEKLIHFSSDYVFNGENGPYAEEDPTGPINYHGETKLKSETVLAESGREHIIIRTNVLFGTGRNIRHNFITGLIDNLQKGKKLHIVTDQFNNPIHAGNLAEAAIEAARSDFNGILHVGGADYLSRYEIALKTAKHFNLDQGLIRPTTTKKLNQKAKRPPKGGLKIDKARKILKTRLLPFDEALSMIKI